MKLQSNDWKKRRTKEKISKIATASDEAFVLLILENIWDEWIEGPLKSGKNEDQDNNEEAVGWRKQVKTCGNGKVQ